MMPGVPERRSHDYVRHGATDLFAASSIADGTVISQLRRHHRAAEFRKFLARIGKAVPAGLEVHLVCDNLATRKTPVIQAWLARHPRFRLHFTPTGSSWINQSERWFGFLTDQMIRRGGTRACRPSRPASASGSSTGTPTRGHSPGPRPPTRSWTHWQSI
jgi:hypothetical protein